MAYQPNVQVSVVYGLRIFDGERFANFAEAIGTHKPYTAPHPYFFYVDLICNCWFTLELVSLPIPAIAGNLIFIYY